MLPHVRRDVIDYQIILGLFAPQSSRQVHGTIGEGCTWA